MCGIAGMYSSRGLDQTNFDFLTPIHHRGPDESRYTKLNESLIFGHVRLSIIDLTETAAQPMHSLDGRWTIVFNGEIYNYLEIKKQLQSSWRGTSDTEVLLAAISEWGLRSAIERCVGMFAFALWDRKTEELILCRDRFGEKPLYYTKQDDVFAFASELKAFKQMPGLRFQLNSEAIHAYLESGVVPGTLCIYRDFHKLLPGSILRFSARSREMKQEVYWSSDRLLGAPSFVGSYDDALRGFDQHFTETMGQMIRSDVPIGAFLSGGIDSTTVVSKMTEVATNKVKTFTIGFKDQKFNEAEHARQVAKHLGTDHHEMQVTEQDALGVVMDLAQIYDEPFSDSSQIPTVLLSRLTRQHVTVCLSGDAGDELFGGYARYFLMPRLWKRLSRMPFKLQRLAGISGMSWAKSELGKRFPQLTDKIDKASDLFPVHNSEDLYIRYHRHWLSEKLYQTDSIARATPKKFIKTLGFIENMMIHDINHYLPDDILVKVDRASMSASLETRVPFLDHRLAEFVYSLPSSFKFDHQSGKKILKDWLYQRVPAEIMERPKQGFGVPIAQWLRTDLRSWAEPLLSVDHIKQQGLFDSNMIWQKWTEHQSGERNWERPLWTMLMFQQWLRKNPL